MSDHKLKGQPKCPIKLHVYFSEKYTADFSMVNAIINALVVCACPHALLRNLSSLYTYNAWWF